LKLSKGEQMPAADKLTNQQFLRSNNYNPEWVVANASGGAHSLWLTEWLTAAMDLQPQMRVLDLGCGRASGPTLVHYLLQ
jgi:cyclopropane fatty-acyl-phospholipid synthase-like methyltransferase